MQPRDTFECISSNWSGIKMPGMRGDQGQDLSLDLRDLSRLDEAVY